MTRAPEPGDGRADLPHDSDEREGGRGQTVTDIRVRDEEGSDRAVDISTHDQALIEQMLGAPSTKGALRRGFKILPRLLPYLRPYKRHAAVSIVLTILLAVIALAEPWPLAFVVDSVIGDKPAPDWVHDIFGSGTGTLIALAVAAILLVTALAGGLTVWNEYLTTTVDQRMVLDLRSDMFEHAQKLSLAFHDNESQGILMYRINDQAGAAGQIVVSLPAMAQSLLTVVGMAYISVRIDPVLGALALATTPFIVYSTTYYTNRIEPRLYRVRGLGAINLSIVYEAMSMIRVVLAFGTQRREYKRFRTQGETFVTETVGLTVRQTAFKLAVQLITAAGTAAVLGIGAYRAINGDISAGELLVILTYVAQIYQPLEALTNAITMLQQQFISLLMCFDLLDLEPEVTEKPDAVPLERARGEIELEGVGFGYAGRPGVLRNVSARIPAGHAVAVVGPTGAGKSTLASLLPRFYDATEGTVRLDGHDVRDLKIHDLRSQFSIVLQEPLLFAGSIEDNIKYGRDDATHDDIVEAAKAANAHEFIAALPDGYQTVVGERGVKLSGGERQRIAVARAFLRDAPILILDEPTSSIDSRTEAVILDALDRLMQGRTTLVIAHRLSTLRSVDQILVVDGGEVVQRGTHDELLREGGLYSKLWQAQAGTPDIPPQPPSTEVAPVLPAPARQADEPADADRVAQLRALRTWSTPSRGLRPVPGRSLVAPRPKVVLLGMLAKMPVGGVAWLVGQYAIGFQRLGYDVYYVEAHAVTPSMLMTPGTEDVASKAAAYVERVARRFGLDGRWAFQALHDDGHCYGMTPLQLSRLFQDAALIINMHGGTVPLPEHAATDRLVYLGTDPVEVELEVHRGEQRTIDFLDQHAAHFTWGLNFGNPDCRLPWAQAYSFVPSPPPVVLDLWEGRLEPSDRFTSIGNWRQTYRDLVFEGKVLRWSKHEQFMKLLDLPRRTGASMELALAKYDARDRLLLAEHGWRVRPAADVSLDPDAYRSYIMASAGEFSAAKEQNVHFRSGWFSERSATYLAAGRPVVVQDTGFGGHLPTGEGLLGFDDLAGAVEAITAVRADPARHRRAAREIAREFLSHDVVLGDMLDHLGLTRSGHGRDRPGPRSPAPVQFPDDLSLERRPGRRPQLSEATAQQVLRRAVPAVTSLSPPYPVSVVMVVRDDLPCTRLALEALLANSGNDPYELVLVNRSSDDRVPGYLDVLAARNRHVGVLRTTVDDGFGTAYNAGVQASTGEHVVLVSGDIVVPPGWLGRLRQGLEDRAVGLVGPATNRGTGVVRVAPEYRTYGELLAFADRRATDCDGRRPADVPFLELFCVGLRREAFDRVGGLDERFEAGMADDDYARRMRDAGYRVTCTHEVYVHRLGGPWLRLPASASGPPDPETTRQVQAAVGRHVPAGSNILVVSRDDEDLVGFDGRQAWHFAPDDDTGDDSKAIAALEWLREHGAAYMVLPARSQAWLDDREELRRHLERYRRTSVDPDVAVIYELADATEAPARNLGTA